MSGARVHLALLDGAGSSMLWREVEGGWALPSVEIDQRYPADVAAAREALAACGLAVTFLRTLIQLPGAEGRRSDIVQLAETYGSSVPAGYRWRPCPPLDRFVVEPPERRAELHDALLRALDEEADPPPQRPPWARRGWLSRAETWVAAELERLGRPALGPMEQIKQWSITSLWRLPAVGGIVYFKAAPPLPLFADEGGIIGALGERFPGRVPRLLAHDSERRWLLLEAFSGSAVAEDEPEGQRQVARAYATLQVEAAPWRDDLLAAGAVDRRVGSFERRLDRLLNEAEERELLEPDDRARLPGLRAKVMAALDELRDFAIPETLVHGDLHFGNVVLGASGTPLFYDWTDAAISHPFFDLVTLFDFPDDPRDERWSAMKLAYLEPWLEVEPRQRLLRACELGVILGYAFHAVSYQSIREATEPGARWELEGMTALGLRRLLALL